MRHFPNAVGCGDITGIGNDLEKIDILTAGFPCQSFSIAGKGGGFNDPRGALFFEIERIARQYKPAYMVLENVKNIFYKDNGFIIRTILDSVRRLDYSVQLLLLNTIDFGIPQNRERAIFICNARGFTAPEISDIREKQGKIGSKKNRQGHFSGCISTANQGNRCNFDGGSTLIIIPANDRFRADNKISEVVPTLMPGVQAKNSDNNPIIGIDISGFTPTLRSATGWSIDKKHNFNVINDNMILRRLTPLECERLQGFPDDWTRSGADGEIISDTQRYKFLGNAVTVKVIEAVAINIRNVIRNDK